MELVKHSFENLSVISHRCNPINYLPARIEALEVLYRVYCILSREQNVATLFETLQRCNARGKLRAMVLNRLAKERLFPFNKVRLENTSRDGDNLLNRDEHYFRKQIPELQKSDTGLERG